MPGLEHDTEMKAYLASALGVLEETAVMLGVQDFEVRDASSSEIDEMSGASVAVLRQGRPSVDVQVLGSEKEREGVARVVLAMEQDEPLDPSDVTDALAEIANIVAGGLTAGSQGCSLGLPEPIGPMRVGQETPYRAHVVMGGAPVLLVLRVN